MPKLLETLHAHPLEREYEAWIVANIEDRLTTLGHTYAIWAVSPDLEATWPADEVLATAGKLVGLQFKQAKVADGTLGPNRLKWTLHKPGGQFEMVQAAPEIFYCLPTFINRAYRSMALDHCLFWRPGLEVDYNVWYDNPKAQTPYKSVRDSMRWGRFLEALLHCEVGKRSESAATTKAQIAALYQSVRDSLAPKRRSEDEVQQPVPGPVQPATDLGLYLMYVKL